MQDGMFTTSDESMTGQTGAEPCPCDNLKYGPPDANGRRTIFIPETAWADEPLPPMPRRYGLEPACTESRDIGSAVQGVSVRPYRPQQEMPDPGQVWAEYPNQSMFIEPARSTNPNVCHLPGPQPEQRSTFLGDSAAGGPFGSKTLAELGIFTDGPQRSSGATTQDNAGGASAAFCPPRITATKRVAVAYFELIATSTVRDSNDLEHRIGYHRRVARDKAGNPEWRSITARELAQWITSGAAAEDMERAVATGFSPRCIPPCKPIVSIHDKTFLGFETSVHSEMRSPTEPELDSLRKVAKEIGPPLRPAESTLTYIVALKHTLLFAVHATVECVPA